MTRLRDERWRDTGMTAIALLIVWALVLGWSPGLALIAVALTLLALDHLPFRPDRLRG